MEWSDTRHCRGRKRSVVAVPKHITAVDRAPCSFERMSWLTAILQIYQPNVLQGLAIMEALRTLTRIELLESSGPTPSLTREHKLFLVQWSALQLER